MLPFLKKDKETSVAVDSDPMKREPDEDYDGLQAAADDLIAAIESKDAKAVAMALRAAFEICESEPHEEGT